MKTTVITKVKCPLCSGVNCKNCPGCKGTGLVDQTTVTETADSMPFTPYYPYLEPYLEPYWRTFPQITWSYDTNNTNPPDIIKR